MYYNNSNFPFFIYKISGEQKTVDEILENYLFLSNQPDFINTFINNIDLKVGQDLFLYLFTTIPAFIFSTEKKFELIKPYSTIFNEPTDFRTLINIRINLKQIHSYLEELKDHELIESVDSEKTIHELVLFVNNYLFFQLKKLLKETSFGTSNQFLDIIKTEKKVAKYSEELANSNSLTENQIQQKQNFIDSYLKGFYTDDIQVIELIRKDLLHMNSITNQKKRLWELIESGIVFEVNTTSTQQNELLLFFYKEIVYKLFFAYLDTHDESSFDIKEKFRDFKKKLRK
ncbi:MAG: hypothetical protein RL699_1680 [Bacteroidota bacterium]|jgi:hypothetical protein